MLLYGRHQKPNNSKCSVDWMELIICKGHSGYLEWFLHSDCEERGHAWWPSVLKYIHLSEQGVKVCNHILGTAYSFLSSKSNSSLLLLLSRAQEQCKKAPPSAGYLAHHSFRGFCWWFCCVYFLAQRLQEVRPSRAVLWPAWTYLLDSTFCSAGPWDI